MPRIIFTVTNDLNYDQRMQRIAGTLADAGYEVLLTGRELPGSLTLTQERFQQRRIKCLFNKGALFYAEYNLRLFFFLLFARADILCAIDLDTILPVYFISVLKRCKRVYDAHELFTEQQEIITRPRIRKIWLAIERWAVPAFRNGYTVNGFLAAEFARRYNVYYAVVRNLPLSYLLLTREKKEKWIIYQGAVNEGRCFETLIPAMKEVNAKLVICGEGNFFEQARELIRRHALQDKVELKGYVSPKDLKQFTQQAYIGVTLFERAGLNQYHSLANRFFDYIMAVVPQVCVNFPEYQQLNDQYGVASMINDTKTATIAAALNNLLSDDVLYKQLTENSVRARTELNWETEKQALVNFYNHL